MEKPIENRRIEYFARGHWSIFFPLFLLTLFFFRIDCQIAFRALPECYQQHWCNKANFNDSNQSDLKQARNKGRLQHKAKCHQSATAHTVLPYILSRFLFILSLVYFFHCVYVQMEKSDKSFHVWYVNHANSVNRLMISLAFNLALCRLCFSGRLHLCASIFPRNGSLIFHYKLSLN